MAIPMLHFASVESAAELGEPLVSSYNLPLVGLSVFIASLAAFAALGASSRVGHAPTSTNRALWLIAGAVSMGTGVWAMHFVGMLAFRLPVVVGYDIAITIGSMVPAVLAAGIVLHLVDRDRIALRRMLLAGVLMGSGIGAMHYAGMAAMRMDALMYYDPISFVGSVVVAVILSIFALYTKQLASRRTRSLFHWTNLAAASAMGAAISGMHYTGMYAAHFYPGEGTSGTDLAVLEPVWVAVWIGLAVSLFIALAIFLIVLDRRVESLGQRFSYALTATVSIVLFGFAVVAIFLNIHNVQASLEAKLTSALNLSDVSLQTPLWNVDLDGLEHFFEALLLDPDIVLAQVIDDGSNIITRTRESFKGKTFDELARSGEFLYQTRNLTYEETPIGILRLVVSRANVREEILTNVIGIVALTTFLVSGIALTAFVITRRYVARPLSELQSSAAMIAGGRLDTPINTASLDEVGLLAKDLDTMRQAIQLRNSQLQEANATLEDRVAARTAEVERANDEIVALNDRLAAENLRMGAELEVTRRLQQMLLPTQEELQNVAELDIAGFMDPADEVGGDYYDVLQHDGRVKIGIGDVTGHGLESGVMMVMVQTVVRALLVHGETDPVLFLDTLNRALYGNAQRMGSDKNLTLSLIDYVGGNARLSGQHEEMIVMRRDGELELIDTIDLGFPIALDSEISDFINHTTVKLDPGDGVVLYTDGITEAENAANEQFGLERLCEVVRANWSQPAEAIKDAVVSTLKEYIGQQTVYDDITLVVVKQR